nr:hypothetical protein [Micromonospora sp. 4G55]
MREYGRVVPVAEAGFLGCHDPLPSGRGDRQFDTRRLGGRHDQIGVLTGE